MDREPRRWHLLRRSRFTVEVWATEDGSQRRIGSMRMLQSGPNASVLAWRLEGTHYRSTPIPGGRRSLVAAFGNGGFGIPRRIEGPKPLRLAFRWGGIEFESDTAQGGVYDRASADGGPYRAPVVLNGVILGVCRPGDGGLFSARDSSIRKGLGRWISCRGMDFHVDLHASPSEEGTQGLQVALTLARLLGIVEETP